MSAILTDMYVTSIEETQDAILSTPAIQVAGGRTKPVLSSSASGVSMLDMSGLSGILEYDPGEYTFSALAGTPLSVVQAALAEHGQYMPFDPPMVGAGATLGGTVAAGLSGSGRHRYGGVRDFLLGIRFVDGRGRLVRGGGKVVKNAAGFDLPKLFVGSLGQFGALVEVSFKVFPQPSTYATLVTDHDTLTSALDGLSALASAPFDIDALDVAVNADDVTTLVRVGGLSDTIDARLDGIAALLGKSQRYIGETEKNIWQDAGDFTWVTEAAALVKVALSPTRVASFDETLRGSDVVRRYAVGGNLAWLAWNDRMGVLEALLAEQGLAGLVLTGETARPIIGDWAGTALYRRVKQTLDPDQRFPDYLA